MTFRVLLIAFLALVGAPVSAVSTTRSAPEPVSDAPMMFYVVKGPPDACGHGCDRWIAMEGKIDSAAAPRFWRFLEQTGGRGLPMYFSSPGGDLGQALTMGAMLRKKPATARVAHTIVNECGFEAQDSDVCRKLKQSGRELHGDLRTRGAMCNSACPYLMLGATTREIAPDALLAIHSPKVTVRFRFGQPSPEVRDAAIERGHESIDRRLSLYIVKMGADPGLFALASTIKFEDMHILTRDEIARFGIDRREMVETPWTFENIGRGVVRKVVSQKHDGDSAYHSSQWRLLCFNTGQFELDFQREATANARSATVSIANSGPRPLYFTLIPSKPPGFELWALRTARLSLQSLADGAQFDLTEASRGVDGSKLEHVAKISSEGLAGALDSLLATCPPPRTVAPLQGIGARDSVAK
jgi:hypothetical protein